MINNSFVVTCTIVALGYEKCIKDWVSLVRMFSSQCNI